MLSEYTLTTTESNFHSRKRHAFGCWSIPCVKHWVLFGATTKPRANCKRWMKWMHICQTHDYVCRLHGMLCINIPLYQSMAIFHQSYMERCTLVICSVLGTRTSNIQIGWMMISFNVQCSMFIANKSEYWTCCHQTVHDLLYIFLSKFWKERNHSHKQQPNMKRRLEICRKGRICIVTLM